MDLTATLSELKKLSREERLRIADELWDSVEAEEPGEFAVDEVTRRLLDERLAEHDANPNATLSEEEVRERLMRRIKA